MKRKKREPLPSPFAKTGEPLPSPSTRKRELFPSPSTKKREPLPSPVTKTSELLPFPIKVVSDAEAEEADCVVCMLDGEGEYFRDDVRTVCSLCKRKIHHRPHVPKKPRKLCVDCALLLMESDPPIP